MKFGVRQIANVVFKAKNLQKIGPYTFQKGQPVFYMDTAKTSTLEGAATTVYATGGRGNTRLIAWEGEKTLTVCLNQRPSQQIVFTSTRLLMLLFLLQLLIKMEKLLLLKLI